MRNNLSLAGSEIISESKSRYNNSIISITSQNKNYPEQKIITKSYKILDPNSSNVNNISSNNIETSKTKRPSQSKKGYSLDLSKIKYNDGYILTDAANSNPGFGLWALKIGLKDKIQNTLSTKRKSVNNVNNISTIKNNVINNINEDKITITANNISNNKINDKSMSLSNNSKNEENKNKLIIEDLKMICNDLEQKCTNLMSDLKQKIYMCNNSIKLKNEYENILKENNQEIEQIKEKCTNLSTENNKLNNIYKNVENELIRLLNVMKTDKENMEKIKEEFNSRLKQEEVERERLNNIFKKAREKVHILEQENEKISKENKNDSNKSNIEIITNKDSEARKEFEEENLNNLIIELELKICGMKKKINTQEEENEKLRKILKFKEERNDMENYKLMNLNNLLKIHKENQKNDLNIVSKQNSLITELRKGIRIKTNNKMTKSFSIKKIIK